jgi:hypothetical protein
MDANYSYYYHQQQQQQQQYQYQQGYVTAQPLQPMDEYDPFSAIVAAPPIPTPPLIPSAPIIPPPPPPPPTINHHPPNIENPPPPPPPPSIDHRPPTIDNPPPPPPLASAEIDYDESAYSPSQALNDDDNNESENLSHHELSAISTEANEKILQEIEAARVVAQQEQLVRMEREREEHARRLEAENRKRKTTTARAMGAGGKLRRVGLKAFGADDDEDGPEDASGKKSTPAVANAGANAAKQDLSELNPTDQAQNKASSLSAGAKSALLVPGTNSTSTTSSSSGASAPAMASEAEVPPEELLFILNTAAWVAGNPEQGAALVKLKQQERDRRFEFLLESGRFTAAGRSYREELQRCRAERDVQAVFAEANNIVYGPPPVPFGLGQQSASSGLGQPQLVSSGFSAGLASLPGYPGVSFGHHSSSSNIVASSGGQSFQFSNPAVGLAFTPAPPASAPPTSAAAVMAESIAAAAIATYAAAAASATAASLLGSSSSNIIAHGNSSSSSGSHGFGAIASESSTKLSSNSVEAAVDKSFADRRRERKNKWGPPSAAAAVAAAAVADVRAGVSAADNVAVDIVTVTAQIQQKLLASSTNSTNSIGASAPTSTPSLLSSNNNSNSSSSSSTSSSRKFTEGNNSTATTATTVSSVSAAYADYSFDSSANASDEAERDARFTAQIREQKQLQLLESRIRDAARGAVGRSLGTASSSAAPGTGMPMTREEELYQERLRQYNELAARYDEDFKDTIHDAEKSGGA